LEKARHRKKKIVRHLALLLTIAVLAGCSTYAAQRYAISADNVTALRTLNGKTPNVGPFTSSEPGQSEIMCRAVGPIKTPDGEPFADFIRKALVDELKIANAFAPTAPVTLTGNLNSIDFSSASGTWDISLTVQSSNGQAVTVAENYAYTSSFYGETACNQTAQALMPAVQNLIGNFVHGSAFQALISNAGGTMPRSQLSSPPPSAPLPPLQPTVLPQDERQPEGSQPIPQKARKAHLDVVQVQPQYNPASLLSAPA